MLQRDVQRFAGCFSRADVLPVRASYGTVARHLDHHAQARMLGMAGVTDNSIDAGSDRDFIVEFCAATATTIMHLARFAAGVIGWPLAEADRRLAEWIRHEADHLYGHPQALLRLMAGMPLMASHPTGDTIAPLADAAKSVRICLGICVRIVNGLLFDSGAPAADEQRQFDRVSTLIEQNRTLAGDLRDAITGGAMEVCAS
jgi:argininosuccinate lyase